MKPIQKYDLSASELRAMDELISFLGESSEEDQAKAGVLLITIAALDTAPYMTDRNIGNMIATQYAATGGSEKAKNIESLLRKINSPEGLTLEKLIAIRNQNP